MLQYRVIPIGRVVSPEVSSGKFPEIYSNFSGKIRKFLFPEILVKIQYKPSK